MTLVPNPSDWVLAKQPNPSDWVLAKQPEPVGYWVIGQAPGSSGWCTKFAIYHKATEQQIKNTEELLGWKWEDVK